MRLHLIRIVAPAALGVLALFSVSCSSMNFGGFGNSGRNAGGMQAAQDPYARQQPYYQGQQQPYYGAQGGQGYQQAPGAGYGAGAYQPSAGQGYPSTPPAYAPSQAGGSAPSSHVVVRGDTLWSISQRYGSSVGAIQAANNLSGDVIRPGEVLQIP